MKRNLIIAILAAAVLIISGCTEKENTAAVNTDGKINVTTSIFAPYDFVRAIAGDRVNLSMLLPPGAESHSFEPSPRDIITIQNSDIFIYTGGETDEWIAGILQSTDAPNMKVLAMMDTVETVEEEIVEGMEDDEHDHGEEADHDEHEGEHHEEEAAHEEHEDEHHEEETVYDEHVWTSPQNAVRIVNAITDLLCETDSANADFFRQNAAAYTASLTELDSEFREISGGAQRKTIVFGDRFPFRYFADAYGLEYFAAFPGCSTETEPSAATVAFLIDKIKSDKIPVVFHIELSNERMANTIASETGAKKLLLHACHNITKNDFDSGLTYLDIMKRNTQTLREALN